MTPGKPPVEGTSASSDAAFAEAHRRLIEDDSIQFQLQPVEIPDRPDLSGFFDFLQAAGPVVKVLFWVALIAIAAFLIYLIALRITGASWPWRRGGPVAPDESWRPAEAPARQLLAEADGLAADGRFSEAAHLLLFRSIEDIDGRRPDLVRPALTSRDIAGLSGIPERPRGAFARIAMAVERSLFARRPLVEGDWRDCRAAYEEFAFAEGWRG